MTVGRRRRLSLLARMGVAVCILVSAALVATAALAGLGAVLGLVLSVWGNPVAMVLGALPRLSARIPVGPAAVAATAGVGLFVAAFGWPTVARVLPGDVSAKDLDLFAGPFWELACLYLLLVEGVAAVRIHAPAAPDFLFAVVAGAALVIWSTVVTVRSDITDLRDALLDDSVPAEEEFPAVPETTHRLAQLAAVPRPDVYVTETDRPESFTIGTGASAKVIVSTGLVETLSSEQLEAVLAHEVSHLANADSTVMAAALTPVLMADDLVEEDASPSDWLWNAPFAVLKLYGQFGVAVLSKGREWRADAAAAALTGSPATLATALERIDDARRTPSEDLREWEQTVAAIDILPPAASAAGTGPFETHPPTDERIERLRELAARAEQT